MGARADIKAIRVDGRDSLLVEERMEVLQAERAEACMEIKGVLEGRGALTAEKKATTLGTARYPRCAIFVVASTIWVTAAQIKEKERGRGRQECIILSKAGSKSSKNGNSSNRKNGNSKSGNLSSSGRQILGDRKNSGLFLLIA